MGNHTVSLTPNARLKVRETVEVALPEGGTKAHKVDEQVLVPLEAFRKMKPKDVDDLVTETVAKGKATEEARLKKAHEDKVKQATETPAEPVSGEQPQEHGQGGAHGRG